MRIAMDLNLAGKVAIVTGGSRGIGFAAAKALRAQGARVVIAARDEARLAQARAELDGQALAVSADLARSGAEREITQAVLAAYGRIDILVNSAGSAQGAPFWELSDDDWQANLALKLFGTIRMMRAVVPVMRMQRHGRIVTVAGAAGRQPDARFLPVAVANAGLLAITRGLADELGPDGIAVVAINPGVTRTDRFMERIRKRARAENRSADDILREVEREVSARTPLRRIGEPDDIAAWIAFLASDQARHFTGQSITIDGGLNRPPG
jgi:3-oxoacyl-[acyl-carrier protein] reductase